MPLPRCSFSALVLVMLCHSSVAFAQPIAPAMEPEPAPAEPSISEGRAIVSAWNSGFQWSIAPGLIFAGGKANFSIGVRAGYGFDLGPVILVPGARVGAYFIDPNVYLGMPIMKVVIPIDRFAPFVEGGLGLGHVSADDFGTPSATGAAVFFGGGFMVHFTPSFALGAEANYQLITGTGFKGFGLGPILALGF